jgi:ABC-type glycerol-3-phosphate transport system substrate-binding protein
VLEANPHFAQLHRAFAGARPRPVRPDYPKASDIIQLGLHRILAGQATAAQGLAEIQRDLMGL